MSMLSVRLPNELNARLPRKDRSAWVVEAIRQRLRRERIRNIARSAADHPEEELEAIEQWSPVSAPLPEKQRKRR
jgi:hypothetical protein